MKLKKLKGLLTPDSKITIKNKKGKSIEVHANDESFDTYGNCKIDSMYSDVKAGGKIKKEKKKSFAEGVDESIMEMKSALGIESSEKEDEHNDRDSKSNRSFKKRWEHERERNKRDRYENKEDLETKRSSNILNEFAESTLKKSNENAEEKKKLNEEAPYAAAIDNDSKNRKGFQKRRGNDQKDQETHDEETKREE